MPMKYAEVAGNMARLMDDLPDQDKFIYDLLLAYGSPKASVTRLKSGTYNQSKVPGEVLWKKKIWFKNVAQASRLSDSVPQASRLPKPAVPNDHEQAGRSLYDPDKMPDGLREAHHQFDLAVDRLTAQKPFTSDEELLEHLFKLYEKMIKKEQLV